MAGALGMRAKHTNAATAIGSALSGAGKALGKVTDILDTLAAQDDEKITQYMDMTWSGASIGNQSSPGAMDEIARANANNPENIVPSFNETWDEKMTAESIAEGANVSVRSAERWLRDNGEYARNQYEQAATGIQNDISRLKALSTEEYRQKLMLNQASSWEEALDLIRAGYDNTGMAQWDNGDLSVDNPQHRAELFNAFAEINGKVYVEDKIATTDMTMGEIVDEFLNGEYAEILASDDFSGDSGALLSIEENKEALKASLYDFGVQQAGVLQQEAEAKAVRAQNEIMEYVNTGYELTDEKFMEIMSRNLDMDNRFDQAAFTDAKYAQFGWDRDMSEEMAAVNAILDSPEFIPDLVARAEAEPEEVRIKLYDDEVTSTINSLNGTLGASEGGAEAIGMLPSIDTGEAGASGPSSGSITLSTRYGSYIQEMAKEYGLSAEQTEYLARSVNQYVATAENWNSEKNKKRLTSLAVNPALTESEYRQTVENMRMYGLIDDTTYDEFIDKKSSPYQDQINRAEDRIEQRLNAAFADDEYTGKMRWEDLCYRNDFVNNIERMVTSAKNAGVSDEKLDAMIDEYATSLITVLGDEDASDLIFKSADSILEGLTDYDPNIGFKVADIGNLRALNEAYLNSEYSAVFNDNAVGAGTLYLQGSPSTRSAEGLYDAVAKALYGQSATYENLSDTEQQIVKANGGVALAQYSQYVQAAEMFKNTGTRFQSVNIKGYGITAMDSDGFIYMPNGDNLYTITYVSDATYRKQLLGGGNFVIDPADTKRLKSTEYRLKWKTVKPIDTTTQDNPGIDQYFGQDTLMRDQDDPNDPLRNEAVVPILGASIILPSEDVHFEGLKARLKAWGGQNAV